MWVVFASLSAIFAGITSILAKCGIKNTSSTLATAIRTIVVLLFAWIMVFIVGSWNTLPQVDWKSWLFLVLSGLATGASWLCYFKALRDGTTSTVVAIDKLSIIVTIAFSSIVFKEKLSWKGRIGLILIVGGTVYMLF